ncbi:MAG TPA: hypothetical protein VGB66_04690 [Longimicrobium sp.]
MTEQEADGTIRGARWAEGRPYAPLVVCAVLAGVQVISWPVLFVIGVAVHKNVTAITLMAIPAVLWFLLPLGSIYGLYIVAKQNARRQGGCLPVAGFAANVLYLLFGLLTWAAVLAGVRV